MENKREELKQFEAFKELLEAKMILLAKEIEEEQEENEEFPKEGEEYCYIISNGTILVGAYASKFIINKERIAIGNCFRTREEAEYVVERFKVINELKEFSVPFKFYKPNFYLMQLADGKIGVGHSVHSKYNIIYFATKEEAEEAIETVGEKRIKKYYFGIE